MKLQIKEKITKEIENVGKIPKAIIKYGTLFSLLLFFGSAIVFFINNTYFNNTDLNDNIISLMKASTTVLAEVIIGGLLIDYLSKNY